ncbi:MAG: HAMP domain-containing protein [Acetivibrio sp.]
MKIGLKTKFATFFLVFMAVIALCVYYLSATNFKEAIMGCYGDKAISIAHTASTYVTAKQVRYYADSVQTYNVKPETDKAYDEIARLFDNLKEASEVENIYIAKPLTEKKMLYIYRAKVPGEKQKEGYLGWAFNGFDGEKYEIVKETMRTGKESIDLATNDPDFKYLASAYVPILNEKENAIAYIGVDIRMQDIESYMNNYMKKMMTIIVIALIICFLLFMLLMQSTILNPLKVLKRNVEAMADGKLGVQTQVNGTDEVAGIAAVFNRMSQNIEGHVREIELLNESYYKFVPLKMFELIGKSSVVDVRLGDRKNAEVTVCTMHVRDFEKMVHTIPTEGILDYISHALDIFVPSVTEEGGVIEAFEDAGVTAFYTEESERALLSAISACQKMEVMKFSTPSVGITYGPAMIGIVGHGQRLAAATISEQTTMSVFLKRIAPKYNAKILITASAANQIPEFEQRYETRLIGLLYTSSSNRYEKLYDVFDGDGEEDKILKKQTKDIFEKGVKLFCSKKFYEARISFIEVLKQFRKDDAAKEYLYLCDKYYQTEEVDEIACCIERY